MTPERAQAVIAAADAVVVKLTDIANPAFAQFKLTAGEGTVAMADATLRYLIATAMVGYPEGKREAAATEIVDRFISYALKNAVNYIITMAAAEEEKPGRPH